MKRYICDPYEDPICGQPEFPEDPEEFDEDRAYDEWKERTMEE